MTLPPRLLPDQGVVPNVNNASALNYYSTHQ